MMDDLGRTDWQAAARPPRAFGKAATAQSVPEPTAQPLKMEQDDGDHVPAWRAMLLVAIVILGLFWLEALFAGTALITPINRTYLLGMRGLGAAVGLALGVVIFITDATMNGFKRFMVALVMPVIFGALFDGIAWRIADWWEFGLSSAPFEQAQYPVTGIHHGRKGAQDTLEIDPFHTGESADIPIPGVQYDALRSSASDYCVTVMQRRSASGAIEIATDGSYTFQPPKPAALTPC